MPNIGPMELIIIFAIVIIIFGAAKVPEIGRSLGKGMREFTKAKSEIDEIKKPLTVQYWVDAAQPTSELNDKSAMPTETTTAQTPQPQVQPNGEAGSEAKSTSQETTDKQST